MSDWALEEGVRLLAMLGINYPTTDDKAWAQHFLKEARNKALDDAAQAVQGHIYMLGINADEGPLTKQDRVCCETREQAVSAILALKAPHTLPHTSQSETASD